MSTALEPDSLEALWEETHAQVQRRGVDDDAITAARETLTEIESEYHTVTRRNALRRFVVEYLRDQRDAFADGGRQEPVCECNLPECVVKRGQIPGPVRHADDFRDGVERWLIDHPEAVVLREALREFSDKRATVRSELWDAADSVREGV